MLFAMSAASYLLLRRGENAEIAYNNAKFAKAPKYPLKLIAAVLLSVASGISAYFGSFHLSGAVAIAASVFGGWWLYYGFDIREDKLSGYENDKAARRILALIDAAKRDIEVIEASAKRIGDTTVASQLASIAQRFMRIVAHIEKEPDDYDKARRYLVSYLGEIKQMSERYTALYAKELGGEMREEFLQLLRLAREKLDAQYRKLSDDDILDLDIKISVMKKRFEHEE